jgi:hypothetical protein
MAGRIRFRHDRYGGVDGYRHGTLGIMGLVSGVRGRDIPVTCSSRVREYSCTAVSWSAEVCNLIGSREG